MRNTHRHKVDAPEAKIHTRALHLQCCADTIAFARSLAAQLHAHRVELVVVLAECTDVHETLDVQVLQLNEDAERRHGCHRRSECLTEVVAHEVTLQPVLKIAYRQICATLGERYRFRDARERIFVVGIDAFLRKARCTAHTFNARVRAFANQVAQCPMHQQVCVAPNRRGEVCVVPERKSKVAQIMWRVMRLHETAQYHGLDDVRIGTRASFGKHALQVGRTGLVLFRPRQSHAQRCEKRAQVCPTVETGRLVHAVHTHQRRL